MLISAEVANRKQKGLDCWFTLHQTLETALQDIDLTIGFHSYLESWFLLLPSRIFNLSK